MSQYTPDRWVLIELNSPKHGIIRKVLAGWYGGYLGSDAWQISSGVVEVKETDDCYEFLNDSGSIYTCYKQAYGLSNYTASIYSDYERKFQEQPEVGTIRVVDYDIETGKFGD